MGKELRGRKINDYTVEYISDLELLKNVCEGVATEEKAQIEQEYGCCLVGLSNTDEIRNQIKKSILEMYNDEITSTVMLLYNFCVWYKKCIKRLERLEKQEFCEELLDFHSVLNPFVLSNLDYFLSHKCDENNVEEFITYSKYKLISLLSARILSKDDADLLDKLERNISAAISSSYYLELIRTDYTLDYTFLISWEYYPVDKMFRDVINTFNSEISRLAYEELNGKEHHYFERIKNANVDFSSIKSMDIVKDGKVRRVYIANKPIDQATLIYLAKRLNHEFAISYPNRDEIMELSFNLIDSLPKLDNYTIYKFDFKNFFDSVDMKNVYERYIESSNLNSYEKELVLKIAKKYKKCVQGLPTSNALIEIIARDFDDSIKAAFAENGLVFYKRYVDDCILIFNHKVKKGVLDELIKKCCISIFGKNVQLSSSKTSYQTKLDGDATFDYLGYSFTRCYWNKGKGYYYFEFGIAAPKIEKYKKQLDAMLNAYELDGNSRLLLRRIQYYDSRIVFYNYNGSRYVNKSTWDVRGIINSYRMLRRYVIYDDCNIKNEDAGGKKPYRIQKETHKFLKYYIKEKRDSLSIVPQYLQGKGCFNHNLWSGFLKNRSIVFQSNIGWSSDYLSERLIEIGGCPVHKSYYEKTRDYYTLLIKKL